ncbi:MAG TPA: succinate dehydrogenase iron-sulfur subunit [Actinomycetota bacterium]|nr:succinate dehydrogenase iron-sulfur subunit [Actinomycetota bacterium]
MKVALEILRFDPEAGTKAHWASYDAEVEPNGRVLDALHYVKWYLDGTLAMRRSCAHGVCGSDAMLINGHNRLACQVLCKDLTQPITVEPLRGLTVEKDLIVDMEPFFAGYRSVLPWLIHDQAADEGAPVGGRERRQSPAERERYDDTTKCILCAACSTSCPIYWADQSYVGPAAIVNAHRFIFDSRDTGAGHRLELLTARRGVYRCRTTFNCTDACPRGIKVTEAIQEVKRAALFKKL